MSDWNIKQETAYLVVGPDDFAYGGFATEEEAEIVKHALERYDWHRNKNANQPTRQDTSTGGGESAKAARSISGQIGGPTVTYYEDGSRLEEYDDGSKMGFAASGEQITQSAAPNGSTE